MYDKGTRSWCMLGEYVNENYYARFHMDFFKSDEIKKSKSINTLLT